MRVDDLRELFYLWEGVYPHLSSFFLSLYGREEGDFLEFGPFSGGVARELARSFPRFRGAISGVEGESASFMREMMREELEEERLLLKPSSLSSIPFLDGSFDLVILRGAFFFLTSSLLREVERVLAPGGVGIVGGGYGPFTPQEVFSPIASRSRELNRRLGKRWISREELEGMAREAGIEGWEVREEGGLWLILKKGGSPQSFQSLSSALSLKEKEVISLVGGGGKTTLMFSLARELAEGGDKVITTTTTKIFEPHPWQTSCVIVEEERASLMGRAKEALKKYNHVTLGRGRLREQGKLLGIDEDWVEELRGLVPYVIVEADGARRLPIKAPSEGEPVIPPSTTLLLPVVGVDAVGKPLDERWAFRPERVSELTGLPLGVPISPQAVVTLLLHPRGITKGRPPQARVLHFINKVETGEDLRRAEEIARGLSTGDKGVVLGRIFFHRAILRVVSPATLP